MTLDKNNELGEFLRHEREKRGITLEQVASATKIGVRTLHALEEGQYSELPAKPFIRGFIISYCRFIGLDPKDVLGQFEDHLVRRITERPNRETGHSGYAFEKRDGEQQSRTILIIAILIFMAVGGLAMLILKPSLHRRHHSNVDKLRATHGGSGPQGIPSGSVSPSPSVKPSESPHHVVPTTTAAVPAPVPVPLPKPIPSVIPSPSASPSVHDPLDSGLGLKPEEIKHKVSLKMLADVWVRYKCDQRPERKFIVRKDRMLILRAKEGIRLQISNFNSAMLKYNGRGPTKASLEKKKTFGKNEVEFFPEEFGKGITRPFEDTKPLPNTPDPVGEPSQTPSV